MALNRPYRVKICSVLSFFGMAATLWAQNVPPTSPSLAQTGSGQQAPVRHSRTQAFSVVPDSGSFSFLPPVAYNTGGYNVTSVAIADVNHDGKLDLVTANACSGVVGCPLGEGSVGVLMGNGDGTFQAPVNYDAANLDANTVIVADVNGDGKPDIIVAGGCSIFQLCTDDGVVAVLLGKGDGTFQPAVPYSSGGMTVVSVVAGDVNGDGKLDLLIANQCADGGCANGSVGVLLGKGDGTFHAAVTYSSGGVYGGGFYSGGIQVADLKGDGKLDLVVSNFCASACTTFPHGEGSVGVLLGNGNGTFQPVVLYDSGGSSTDAIVLADVNRDGKLDLLTANCGPEPCAPGNRGGVVGVLLGNGDGTFRAPASYLAGTSPIAIAVGDMDGDGKPDVVVGNWGTSDAGSNNGSGSVLLGNGDGTFQAPQSYLSGGNEATSVAVADLNGDGEPDFVLGDFGGNGSNTPPGIVSVLLNNTNVSGTHTTTTLVSAPNPSAYGQIVTFTAMVSSTSGTPTGTVVFYDGTAALGSATIMSGSASLSTSSVAAGSRSITAVYLGSGGFGTSTSPFLNQVVSPIPTSISLASSVNPTIINQFILYTATITTENGVIVTGTVTFWDGDSKVFTVTPTNNQATFGTSYEEVRNHSITAVYPGDGNNIGSVSNRITEVIGRLNLTKTALVSSGSPSFVGRPVTFTATVTSPDATIPDGSLVTFQNGSTVIGTGTTTGGVATFTTSSLSAKTHLINATFHKIVGFGGFKESIGLATQVVNKYATATTLVSSLNPSIYGQAVTWTATVTSTGPNSPTGKVKFSGIAGASVIGGVATITRSWLSAETQPITAEYEGDDASEPSSSPVLNQVVNPASTSIALTSSANPSSAGQSVTFTAKVTSSTGAHPTGSVTFTAGTANLGTVALNGVVASLSTTALPAGPTTITATYNGAKAFTGSSVSLSQTVQ